MDLGRVKQIDGTLMKEDMERVSRLYLNIQSVSTVKSLWTFSYLQDPRFQLPFSVSSLNVSPLISQLMQLRVVDKRISPAVQALMDDGILPSQLLKLVYMERLELVEKILKVSKNRWSIKKNLGTPSQQLKKKPIELAQGVAHQPGYDRSGRSWHSLLNKGRPVMEGIQGEPVTDSVPTTETVCFIKVSGKRLTLLEPPEDVPGECSYAAAECASEDEETVSLDSRSVEYPDAAQSHKQPGNITSQTVRTLYAKHLERPIELADVNIKLEKRKLQEMELDLEIKRRTLRKLDLEIQKLQREDSSDSDK